MYRLNIFKKKKKLLRSVEWKIFFSFIFSLSLIFSSAYCFSSTFFILLYIYIYFYFLFFFSFPAFFLLYNIQHLNLFWKKCYFCFCVSYSALINFQFSVVFIRLIISDFTETRSICELWLINILFSSVVPTDVCVFFACNFECRVWRFHVYSYFLPSTRHGCWAQSFLDHELSSDWF